MRINKLIKFSICLTCFVLFPALPNVANAGSKITLRQSVLTPPKSLADESILDLNGDGRFDIVVTLQDHKRNRMHRVVIYFQKPGGFSGPPDVIIDLPKKAVMVDFGRINNDRLQDMVVLTDRALIAYRQTSGGGFSPSTELLIIDPMLRLPTAEFMIISDFFLDLNGDGKDDLLIPAGTGYEIRLRKSDGSFADPIYIEQLVTISFDTFDKSPNPLIYRDELVWHYSVPKFEHIDFNGDGHRDLVFPVRDGVTVLYADGKGGFVTPAKTIRIELPPSPEGGFVDSRLTKYFKDTNGDGLPEIWAIRYYGKGIRSRNINLIKTEIFSFNGRRNFPAKLTNPYYRANFNGYVLFPPKFADFNGDGRLDFALFYKELSITSIIASFFLGSLGLDVIYFLQSPSRHFDNTQSYSRKARADFDFNTFLINYDGDFNGDGKPDLLSGRFTENEFDIMFGNSEGEFGTADDIYFNAQLSNSIRIFDIDGNGYDDLIEYNVQDNRITIFNSIPEN
jgi:FG-GAP-like repeat